MEFLYYFLPFVPLVAYIFILVAVFAIKKSSEKQAEFWEYQNGISKAQLELTASIAEKLGVPLKDINGVTSDFGITFEE